MPKRVLDFDALWSSDKIAACASWAQAEYAWLYGLADCNGCFELTNLRVIWGRVAAIRHALTLERLEQIFQEFIAHGLLFTWQAGGKRYGHWTGSDQPGRLPPPSWRARLERLAPPVPKAELAAFMARFSQSHIPQREVTHDSCVVPRENTPDLQGNGARPLDSYHYSRDLKPDSSHSLEAAQAQGLDLDKGREKEVEWELVAIPDSSAANGRTAPLSLSDNSSQKKQGAETPAFDNGISCPQPSPAIGASASAQKSSALGTTGAHEKRRPFVPNRSALAEARVGVGPVLTTGRIRRDALDRILKREALNAVRDAPRRAIPP